MDLNHLLALLNSLLPFSIGPGSGIGQSAGAGSPFTNYTAGVAIFTLLVGFLVTSLLIGGFLVLNIGLLSKRPEDRIGNRTPSMPGILKTEIWPEEPYKEFSLPAEEEDEEYREERPSKVA